MNRLLFRFSTNKVRSINGAFLEDLWILAGVFFLQSSATSCLEKKTATAILLINEALWQASPMNLSYLSVRLKSIWEI